MVECPECGYELDDDELPTFDGPLCVEDGAAAILKKYIPAFNLGERLALADAIRKCLVEQLGVSLGKL